jgi:hypothetical protein
MDKHSSLLRKFEYYDRKKFYNIGPWVQYYKTVFSSRPNKLEYLPLARPSLMLVGKAMSLPLSGALRIGWETLTSDKHSSLLLIFVRPKRQCYKTFFSSKTNKLSMVSCSSLA